MKNNQTLSNNNKLYINFDTSLFLKTISLFLVIYLFFLGLTFLPKLLSVVYLLIAALLLSIVLSPIVNLLEKFGLNRNIAIISLYLSIGLLLAILFSTSFPLLSEQLVSLENYLSHMQQGDSILDISKYPLLQNLPFLDSDEIQLKITEGINQLAIPLLKGLASMISSLPYLMIVAFIVFFLLKDGVKIKHSMIRLMPNRYFEMSLIIMDKTSKQLSAYIRGQLIVATLVGLLSILALKVIGVKYSIIIGAIAGIANLIPYIGPIAGATLAVIVAYVDTGNMQIIIEILIAFTAIQLVENVIISPYVVGRSVEMHPLTIIIVVLIGQVSLGLWGMLLAVPITSIIKVVSKEVFWGISHYRLKDKTFDQASQEYQ